LAQLDPYVSISSPEDYQIHIEDYSNWAQS
jgi:hypothetical protein